MSHTHIVTIDNIIYIDYHSSSRRQSIWQQTTVLGKASGMLGG